MIIASSILRLACRILSWILYLLTIFSAFGGYIPPRIWALPSLVTLAFPYLFIASLVVAVLWLLSRHIFMAIFGALAAIVCWPVATNVCPVAFSSKSEKPDFSLLTYNVYWLHDYQHPNETVPSRTLSYIINSGADIVCLQEIDTLPRHPAMLCSQSDSLRSIYPYIIPGHMHLGSLTPFIFLSRYPAKQEKITWALAPECALYKVTLPGNVPLYVMNVHLTSYLLSGNERKLLTSIRGVKSAKKSLNMDKSIYHKMADAFRSRQALVHDIRHVIDSINAPMIICGDFNDVPGSYAYRVMKASDFNDAIAKTTFGPMITYHAHGFLFHIDQILYRGVNLTPHATIRGSLRSSDHYPLMTTFSYKD